jgi:hypothetical protein
VVATSPWVRQTLQNFSWKKGVFPQLKIDSEIWVFNLYNTPNPIGNAHFYTLFLCGRKSVLISELCLSYIESVCDVFRGDTGKDDAGKRDYQNT